MTDDHTPQPAPGAEVLPAFLCPACGYVCTTTWEARPAHAARAIFSARGKILVTLARMMPLRPGCIHPDGTSRDGGAATGDIPGTAPPRSLSPQEAEGMPAVGT